MVESDPFDACCHARSAGTRAILTVGISESRYESFARTEHVKRLYFVQYLGMERHRRNPWRSWAIAGTGDRGLKAMFRKVENFDGMSRAGPVPVLDQFRRSVVSSPMRSVSNGVVR